MVSLRVIVNEVMICDVYTSYGAKTDYKVGGCKIWTIGARPLEPKVLM